jgi:hypothetical protein
MRRIILCSVICLAAYAVLAGDEFQPLNVKTGLWEMTVTTAIAESLPSPRGLCQG